MSCPACGYDDSLCIQNTYTIVIPRAAQSLNQVGTNHRNNHKYRGARRSWAYYLQRHGALDIPPAEGKRRIFFTRHYGKRKRPFDYGNLVGGFKPLLDMIVDCDLLIDDKPKYCAEYYSQQRSDNGEDYITIRIEDIHEPT